jgi:hypothetical protein
MTTRDNENARPGAESGTGAEQADDLGAMLADPRGTAHYRRRAGYVARDQLDALLDVPRLADLALVEIDYAKQGLTLGLPERRAAGLAILERERAA